MAKSRLKLREQTINNVEFYFKTAAKQRKFQNQTLKPTKLLETAL